MLLLIVGMPRGREDQVLCKGLFASCFQGALEVKVHILFGLRRDSCRYGLLFASCSCSIEKLLKNWVISLSGLWAATNDTFSHSWEELKKGDYYSLSVDCFVVGIG